MRDFITADIYNEIMAQKKPINVEPISWCRFIILSTLLYYTGMRVGETGKFTDNMISEFIEQNSTVIYQSKTGAERRLYLSNHAVKQLKSLKSDRRFIF